MNTPFLTVIMPVYNGQAYLNAAIDTVLNQTFKNFELIIIDDGSTDNSEEIIRQYTDPRIRFLKNDKNRGVAYTRSRGLTEAKGDYLAWMDCDDLISPEKFEKQLQFLQENPDIGICGTWWVRFGEGRPRVLKSPTDPEIIKASLLFYPAINPATAMMRMSYVNQFNLKYDHRLLIAEDYDFYFEASFHFPMQNIGEVLYSYRASETSIMKKFSDQEAKMMEFHKIIYSKAFDKLQIEKTEENFIKHRRVKSSFLFNNWSDFKKNFEWLLLLKSQNNKTKVYDCKAFDEVLGTMFYFISKKSSQLGLSVFFFYLKNLSKFTPKNSGSLLRLFVRCLIKYDKF